ncbi:MAG: hypothetical protein R3F17_07615 [Planctomycetota bacterium]
MIRTIDGVRRAVRTKKVVYPLALRITELVYLGNGRIAVAGLGDDQTGCRTRIEVLTLSPVAVTGVPVQLGGVRYDFEPSSVQERSIGFAPVAEDEFPCIRAMWANRALEGRAVFALAGCTGQVYSIDLETKRAKLVLSADREVGGLGPVPELLLDWLGRSGPARHAEFGDRYGLSLVGDNNVDPPDVPEYLYLWDKNRDGVLDSVEFLSVAQIQARGLWGAPVWDSSWPK